MGLDNSKSLMEVVTPKTLSIKGKSPKVKIAENTPPKKPNAMPYKITSVVVLFKNPKDATTSALIIATYNAALYKSFLCVRRAMTTAPTKPLVAAKMPNSTSPVKTPTITANIPSKKIARLALNNVAINIVPIAVGNKKPICAAISLDGLTVTDKINSSSKT